MMLEFMIGFFAFILTVYLGMKCIGLGFKWINNLFKSLGQIGTTKKG